MAKKITAKAATKKSNGKTPKSAFNPDHKISLLVKENPNVKGSKEFKRFALYKKTT